MKNKIKSKLVNIGPALIFIGLIIPVLSSAKDYAILRKQNMVAVDALKTQYQLPSLSVAVSIDGKIVFAEAAGYADVKTQKLATANTQYSVGSLAKPMTAIALGRLVDDKKISLDADIHQYLPDYPKLPHSLTIKQLASHTGGIGRPWERRKKVEFEFPQDHRSPMEVLDIFSNQPLAFEPGTDFSYTSCGYILLSAVIEAAAKQNFIDYMKKSVWLPLDMHDTELDTSQAGFETEAKYYKGINSEGEFTPSTEKRDRSFLFGAGGFISTPSDLVRLSDAIFKTHYLSPQVKQSLFTPITLPEGKQNNQRYGLGWRMHSMEGITINGVDAALIHHGGTTSGAASAFLLVLPKYNAAIAFTTNRDLGSWENAKALRSQVGKILLTYL